MKIISLSIIISLFNEEANIASLLSSLIKQRSTNFVIKEILISTDACTDNTVKEIYKVNNDKFHINIGKKRQGKMNRINKMLSQASGDIIIILDGDVLLASNLTLEILISPFIKNKNIGVVSGKAKPITGKTLIEKSVNVSVAAYHEFIDRSTLINNPYAWEGRLFAIKKSVIKDIQLPINLVDDIYFYFLTICNGYNFYYAKNAVVLYRSPAVIKEQIIQNKRFGNRMDEMYNIFGEMVRTEFTFPTHTLLYIKIKYFFTYPFLSTTLLVINTYSHLKHIRLDTYMSGYWETLSSTKRGIAYE